MNYFNYFTEIETRFQQRRGSLLMLSTLDWALIETWREAGIPLEAVLRGIDSAFDKHDAQGLRAGARRQRKVNGLAWCAQAVMESTGLAREAAVGTTGSSSDTEERESGFDAARVSDYLVRNATRIETTATTLPAGASPIALETGKRLRELADSISAQGTANTMPSLEDTDRTLSVLEEKLFAALLSAAPEQQLVALREQADRELAPYRSRMSAVQIKQVQGQFLQKRLLEAYSLPRLSLFYMPHE